VPCDHVIASVPLARQGWLARSPLLKRCVVSSQTPVVTSVSSRKGVIDTEPVVAGMPQLAEETELIGEYQGSGFQEPRYIFFVGLMDRLTSCLGCRICWRRVWTVGVTWSRWRCCSVSSSAGEFRRSRCLI
jgi:hypothetical protein